MSIKVEKSIHKSAKELRGTLFWLWISYFTLKFSIFHFSKILNIPTILIDLKHSKNYPKILTHLLN